MTLWSCRKVSVQAYLATFIQSPTSLLTCTRIPRQSFMIVILSSDNLTFNSVSSHSLILSWRYTPRIIQNKGSKRPIGLEIARNKCLSILPPLDAQQRFSFAGGGEDRAFQIHWVYCGIYKIYGGLNSSCAAQWYLPLFIWSLTLM
jgi:hypothetical protein